MKNKKWLRSVAFLLLLTIAVSMVMSVYTLPKDYNSRFINTFEDLPKNTVDGILLGSSVVAHAWVPPVAWEKYGIAAYPFGTSVQPMGSVYSFVEYAMKKHDIKYVILDIHSLREQSNFSSISPEKVTKAYLNIPDLRLRYKMLMDIFDYADRTYEYYGKPKDKSEILDRTKLSNYIPLFQFHNRWVNGLKKADYVDINNKYIGANDKNTAFDVEDMTERMTSYDYEYIEINDFQKNEIELLVSFFEEKGLDVLFINTPSLRPLWVQQDCGSIIKYCADKGYDTIDFSTRELFEKTGLDPATDFVDAGHVNLKGAEKVTDYLSQYLIDNGYYYEDHRGQKGYEMWDEGTENYKAYYEKGWAEEGVGEAE